MFLKVDTVREGDACEVWGVFYRRLDRGVTGGGWQLLLDDVSSAGIVEVARSSISCKSWGQKSDFRTSAVARQGGFAGSGMGTHLAPPGIDYSQMIVMIQRPLVQLFQPS